MKWMRYLAAFFVILCCFFPMPVSAEGETGLSDDYAAYFESSGANELFRLAPENAQEFLEESGISALDENTMLELNIGDLWDVLLGQIADRVSEPVRILTLTLGMVLVAAMMEMMHTTAQRSSNQVFSVVVVLGASAIIVSPLIQLIREITEMIDEVSRFITSFVPVYTGVVAASGKPLSAFAYQSILLTVIQVISYLSSHILIPLICIYLALSISGAATHRIRVGGIANAIRSAVVWCLGLFLTVFVSLLTIKSFVAGATDSVTFRAGKFLVGSLVPIVGSAVSEAMTVVQGSLGVIRTSVGTFGILIIVMTFLPAIITLFFMNMALKISKAASDALGVSEVSGLLESVSFVLSLLLAVLVCFAVMLIVSVSLMLVLSNGS